MDSPIDAAHELDNLFVVIRQFAAAARDRLREGDPGRAELDEVLRAAERGAALARGAGTPRGRAAASGPPPGPRARAGGGPGTGDRVLFVEDDQPVAAITARVLRLAGLDVAVAHTLAAARAALAAGEFDAILSDVELPDGNGLDLLRDLRGANAVTPVVLISGSPSVDVAATAMGLRASNYVQKPAHPDELVRAMTEAIVVQTQAARGTKMPMPGESTSR
jgi:CheY-like chemotaxis protein